MTERPNFTIRNSEPELTAHTAGTTMNRGVVFMPEGSTSTPENQPPLIKPRNFDQKSSFGPEEGELEQFAKSYFGKSFDAQTDQKKAASYSIAAGIFNELANSYNISPKSFMASLPEQINRIRTNIDEGRMNSDVGNEAIKYLEKLNFQYIDRERAEALKDRDERVGFLLTASAKESLNSDAEAWLDTQFDRIYQMADQGNELSSDHVQSVQRLVQEAETHLDTQVHIDMNDFRKLSEEYSKLQAQGSFDGSPESEQAKLKTNYVTLMREKQAQIDKKNAVLKNFSVNFSNRLSLIFMRSTLDRHDFEGAQGSAKNLMAKGLLYGLSQYDSTTQYMINRMDELSDDMRVQDPNKRLEVEVAANIVNIIKGEQLEIQKRLAQSGIGPFAEIWSRTFGDDTAKEEELKRAIERASRTAYDIFVSSGRLGIISARNHHLYGVESFGNDPSRVFANIYNIHDMTLAKFDLLNQEDQEYMDYTYEDLADGYMKDNHMSHMGKEEKHELGIKLFRDLYAVPDFFSSGWRMVEFRKNLEKVLEHRTAEKSLTAGWVSEHKNLLESNPLEYKRQYDAIIAAIPKETLSAEIKRFKEEDPKRFINEATNFGLFMQIKAAGASKEGRTEKLTGLWEKVAKFKTEEIIKLVRDRTPDQISALNAQMKLYGFENYDAFRKQYGAEIRLLRDKGFHEAVPRQINFGSLSAEDKQFLNKATGKEGAGEAIEKVYKSMQSFIESNGIQVVGKGRMSVIDALIKDPRFEDIYVRTLDVTDGLFDQIENIPDNWNMLPVSREASSEPGSDMLVRNYNDFGNAIKAAQALIAFIKSHGSDIESKAKHAEEFGEAISQYSGQDNGRAKGVRYTLGTWYLASRMPLVFDSLGISKLPLRKSMSEIERIYGHEATPLSRDELRVKLDHIRQLLTGSMEKSAQTWAQLTEKERNDRIEKYGVKAEGKFNKERHKGMKKKYKETQKYYHELEVMLRVMGKDIASRRILTAIFGAFVIGFIEAGKIGIDSSSALTEGIIQ